MQYEKVYDKLKAVPLGKLNSAIFAGMNEPQSGATINIIHKVAHHAKSPEEFNGFMETGELPAIKLSDDELELVKGGLLGKILRAVAKEIKKVADKIDPWGV